MNRLNNLNDNSKMSIKRLKVRIQSTTDTIYFFLSTHSDLNSNRSSPPPFFISYLTPPWVNRRERRVRLMTLFLHSLNILNKNFIKSKIIQSGFSGFKILIQLYGSLISHISPGGY